jgi:hypothetical protein
MLSHLITIVKKKAWKRKRGGQKDQMWQNEISMASRKAWILQNK